MVASLVFLTPWGALAALAAVVPLAAVALVAQRERRARRVLRLDDPGGGGTALKALGVVAALALHGAAAAQPALRTTSGLRVRTDAQAIYVIDTSRSMLAATSPRAHTRIARARAVAVQLRHQLADVPAGVATLTDRVLPDLLPVASADVFDRTVAEAVKIDNPPPQSASTTTATTLGALGVLGTQNFFSPAARHRLAVVLTDGESRPYDVAATARALRRAPGVRVLFIRVSSPGETVFTSGRPEQGYHEDPASRAALTALADAAGGALVDEGSTAAAVRFAHEALGRGPSRMEGLTQRTRTLAPWLALASLLTLPLVFGFGGAHLRRLARGRREVTLAAYPAADAST